MQLPNCSAKNNEDGKHSAENPPKGNSRVTCPALLAFLSADKMSEYIIVQTLTAFPARSLLIQQLAKYPATKMKYETGKMCPILLLSLPAVSTGSKLEGWISH